MPKASAYCLMAALGLGSWLAGACGARTTLGAGCAGDCPDAAAGGGGNDGSAGAGGTISIDATGVCGQSCTALAALDCPAGYDAAECVFGCEAALNSPECGIEFRTAVECLLDKGRAQCAQTGAPQFFDPNGSCALALDLYSDCAEARGP